MGFRIVEHHAFYAVFGTAVGLGSLLAAVLSLSGAEMIAAISHLKSGKAQGPDHIAPEYIIDCGTLMLNWLTELFSQCMY